LHKFSQPKILQLYHLEGCALKISRLNSNHFLGSHGLKHKREDFLKEEETKFTFPRKKRKTNLELVS
jgi:hypothetical protein